MNNQKNKRAEKVLPLRLLDIGNVSYLRSQTIYHGLAYAKKKDTPDTIVLNWSSEPYVCIGFHGELLREVDMKYCKDKGLPVLRRETGGGTVYLDENQLFAQWVFSKDNLPHKIDDRFDLFTRPMIQTYRCFDINAYVFPPNDVHVDGKKIVGTGAATIGDAEVMTGNFLFDFDSEAMSKVLSLPDGSFRKMTYDSLRQFMTSIKEETTEVPTFQELIDVYVAKCEKALNRPIERGEISEYEMNEIEKLDRKLSSKEWLYGDSMSKSTDRLVKIHGNVWLFESTHQSKGGSIQIAMRTKGKLINNISIKGDFTFLPEYRLGAFEKFLKNVEIEKKSLKEVIEAFYELHEVDSPGIEVNDWVEVILKIKKQNALTPFS
ncbi:MAG: lipoate protein ligase C-terminal domain-containing protein [Saprospiraceae bacterium]